MRKEKESEGKTREKELRTVPVAGSQSLMVLSLDADTTSLPSGENVMAPTHLE